MIWALGILRSIRGILTSLGARLTAALGGAAVIWVWFLISTRKAYQAGSTDALRRIKDEDYEAAADIRDAVRRDLPDRVRKYENSGWRD